MINSKAPNIFFISHQSSRDGAPDALLSFMRWLKTTTSSKIWVLILYSGELTESFAKVAPTQVFRKKTTNLFSRLTLRIIRPLQTMWIIKEASKLECDLFFGNSISTLPWLLSFCKFHKPTVLYIHETPIAIKRIFNNRRALNKINQVNLIIVPSNYVKESLSYWLNIDQEKIRTVYPLSRIKLQTIQRKEVKCFTNQIVIGGSGALSWHKGWELFVETAHILKTQQPDFNFKFVWIGARADSGLDAMNDMIKSLGLTCHFEVFGNVSNAIDYYRIFDIFLLSSRDESFSIACFENMLLGNPVALFRDTTGIQEILDEDSAILIPPFNTYLMAQRILTLCSNFADYKKMSDSSNAIARSTLMSHNIEKDLLDLSTVIANK